MKNAQCVAPAQHGKGVGRQASPQYPKIVSNRFAETIIRTPLSAGASADPEGPTARAKPEAKPEARGRTPDPCTYQEYGRKLGLFPARLRTLRRYFWVLSPIVKGDTVPGT
jgi:hypothetical protein